MVSTLWARSLSVVLVLWLAALQPEPGDWAERRGQAALALDTQPGNVQLWSDYCVAAWRGGDQSVLKTCSERAPQSIIDVSYAVSAGRLPSGDSGWALRAQVEGLFARARYDEARRAAQRLYEVEPDNQWALEVAINAAMAEGDAAMASALARRGDERFGGPFAGYAARAQQQLVSRGGRADWLFLGGIMLLLWVSFRQAKRHVRGARNRTKARRADVGRLATSSAAHRQSPR